jgi:uncharacterized membrane protein YdcZ (DUF606 family)
MGHRRHTVRYRRRAARIACAVDLNFSAELGGACLGLRLAAFFRGMKRRYRTAGAAVSFLAMLAVLLILSTAACLFDEHGDHHGAPAHDLCAGLVAVAVVSGLMLTLETLGRAYATPRWAVVTSTGVILDPPPRGILR